MDGFGYSWLRSSSPRIGRVVHKVVCLRMEDITFSRKNHQTMGSRVKTMD